MHSEIGASQIIKNIIPLFRRRRRQRRRFSRVLARGRIEQTMGARMETNIKFEFHCSLLLLLLLSNETTRR